THSDPRPSLRSFPTRRSSDLHQAIRALYFVFCERQGHAVPFGEPHFVLETSNELVADEQPRETVPFRQILARLLVLGRTGMKARSEEHTSELQSRSDLVCRLL